MEGEQVGKGEVGNYTRERRRKRGVAQSNSARSGGEKELGTGEYISWEVGNYTRERRRKRGREQNNS